MKVTGKERELGCRIQGQKDSLSSWFTLLSVQTFYADIMQMFSGPCSSKSGGVCCLWEWNLHRLSCLNTRKRVKGTEWEEGEKERHGEDGEEIR